jgi:hypothetical protein
MPRSNRDLPMPTHEQKGRKQSDVQPNNDPMVERISRNAFYASYFNRGKYLFSMSYGR